jgi:hypothetical protein
MKKKYPRIYLGVLLIIPLFLLLLPSNFFDSGDSMCLSIVLFDRECYGCGMTRAIQHLIHFDFSVAYHYNKLSIVVYPLLIFIYFKEVKKWCFLVKK